MPFRNYVPNIIMSLNERLAWRAILCGNFCNQGVTLGYCFKPFGLLSIFNSWQYFAR
jgi:hypothetical protein